VALACRHLRENRLPLKEIALASGFSDQSHLGRISNILNTTPAQYRKGESVRLQELEQAYSWRIENIKRCPIYVSCSSTVDCRPGS